MPLIFSYGWIVIEKERPLLMKSFVYILNSIKDFKYTELNFHQSVIKSFYMPLITLQYLIQT